MPIDHDWLDEPWRPTADEYGQPQEKNFTAGKKQGNLANRKVYLLSTQGPGYVPDERRDPHTYTNPDQPHGKVIGFADLEYSEEPRTPIRETPVHSHVTYGGTVTRFLDGHSEVHSERRAMVREMNHPDTHPDTREDIRDEIDAADQEHGHRNW